LEKHDVAIIGTGPGGYVAAIYLARLGKKVAVIEKDRLGGVCLNRGCIPTKALLSSVRALCTIKEASSYGIDVDGYKIDFDKINNRKDAIVQKLRQGIGALFKARKILLIDGNARLTGAHEIDVSGKRIEADNIIVATGSSPFEVPAFRFDHKNIISSDDILEARQIPSSLIIIGGGVIGCEFATIYTALGCNVTVIEMMSEILPNIDGELAKRARLSLEKKTIRFMVGKKVERINKEEDRVSAILSSGEEISADKVLVCIGRTPNSADLGLQELGIKMQGGRISVDEYMKTNIPNIYAIGDVVGKYQLAHVASYEGVIASRNICGEEKKADYKAVPSCIYSEPEIASVGFSEQAARGSGLDIKIARFPFTALGKANATSKTEGFVKLIGDRSGRILGIHILGEDATNLIAEGVLALKEGLSVEEVGETIHAHPTFSEGLMEACHIFTDRGIHTI
jgi:dihydrolipoamide dehydrogenase